VAALPATTLRAAYAGPSGLVGLTAHMSSTSDVRQDYNVLVQLPGVQGFASCSSLSKFFPVARCTQAARFGGCETAADIGGEIDMKSPALGATIATHHNLPHGAGARATSKKRGPDVGLGAKCGGEHPSVEDAPAIIVPLRGRLSRLSNQVELVYLK
jgi:hypothetical protein